MCGYALAITSPLNAPSGRILSTEFMELPSKKVWPIYYKVIKKPECLEAIRVRLLRYNHNSLPDQHRRNA